MGHGSARWTATPEPWSPSPAGMSPSGTSPVGLPPVGLPDVGVAHLASTTTLAADAALAPGRTNGTPALDDIRIRVERLLAAFLREQVDDLGRMDPALRTVAELAVDLIMAPAKRLRPAFVYWGHRATGAPDTAEILPAAGAVELLHAFALIHDDIMDRSPERRGQPAVHTALAAAHREAGHHGDDGWFGVGGGILAGDLVFVWADQLLDEAPLPVAALDRARRVFSRLRVEVTAGQYLDLRLAGLPGATQADAMRVALLKSGRYTVTRPLQMGAAMGRSDDRLDRALSTYGDAVGLAFQLRDDVLGLFGDPLTTGKGALEDLREGKRTLLMLRALDMCGAAERATLGTLLGDPDLDDAGADRARDIIAGCGALESVERLCREQQERARAALGPVADEARDALEALADLALFRDA